MTANRDLHQLWGLGKSDQHLASEGLRHRQWTFYIYISSLFLHWNTWCFYSRLSNTEDHLRGNFPVEVLRNFLESPLNKQLNWPEANISRLRKMFDWSQQQLQQLQFLRNGYIESQMHKGYFLEWCPIPQGLISSRHPLPMESTKMKKIPLNSKYKRWGCRSLPQNKTVREACHQTSLLLTLTTNKYLKTKSASLFLIIDSVLEESVEYVGGRQPQWRKHISAESLPLTSALKCQSRSFSPLPKCHTAICGLHGVSRHSSGPSHRSHGRWGGRCPGSHLRLPKQMKGAVNGTRLEAHDGWWTERRRPWSPLSGEAYYTYRLIMQCA